jgi:hypothetical protein
MRNPAFFTEIGRPAVEGVELRFTQLVEQLVVQIVKQWAVTSPGCASAVARWATPGYPPG